MMSAILSESQCLGLTVVTRCSKESCGALLNISIHQQQWHAVETWYSLSKVKRLFTFVLLLKFVLLAYNFFQIIIDNWIDFDSFLYGFRHSEIQLGTNWLKPVWRWTAPDKAMATCPICFSKRKSVDINILGRGINADQYPYINYFILCKYCHHSVQDSQRPERAGYHRPSLPSSLNTYIQIRYPTS